MEQRCIRRKQQQHQHQQQQQQPRAPQLPPRRQKSAEEVASVPKSALRQAPEQLEWFDRKAQQRHSARSAEGGQVREETMEWLKLQSNAAAPVPRTSSGPSEITVMKDELPEWLLEHLPKKREQKREATSSAYAKALSELLKKPLSRQSSGPCEFSLLKTDIVEWLTKMQISGQAQKSSTSRRSHHRRNGSSGGGGEAFRSNSQEEQQITSSYHRKRHSLGHSGEEEVQQQQQHLQQTVDWIAYPLNKLQSLGKQPLPPTNVPSGYAVPRSRERKLRHSASEVVTGGTGVSSQTVQPSMQPNLERLYAKPHKERYQYVAKKDHVSSKRERSRRHQTQRSATVSDMSVDRRGGHHKRKSSSAERAPRSPSPTPCTDPSCPLMPICTDPHCRYQECQATTSSISSVNLQRHQQLAQVQLHAVPAHLVGSSEAPTTPSTTATPPPPPPQATVIAAAAASSSAAPPPERRRLVICHECRSCAPLLACQNRKCLNAAKCNSLPRCAADFNRLRTQLAQPP
ncbi:protein still life, isoforms C/SIF type 2-like [Drosophila tropicalis]|uniref:protein still life, isoforms C/SIF type 2-like n=1 Tax=Drosophila tropicalis TaxID=46794 RepID=UPI0035ABCD63